MFADIVAYMKQTRGERRAHLDLGQSCIEIGGRSKEFRGLLAHHLKTTLPPRAVAVLCHACHNEDCSNVAHLYWGTARDNALDIIDNGGWNPRKKPMSEVQKTRIGKSVSAALRGKPKSLEHRIKLSRTASVRSVNPDLLHEMQVRMENARNHRW